jgi:outer membrane phospholipase A
MLAEDLMYRRKLLEQKSLHNDYLSYTKTTMFEKSNETEEHTERLSSYQKNLVKKWDFPKMSLMNWNLRECDIGMQHDRTILCRI